MQGSNSHLHQVKKAAQAERGCGTTSVRMFQVLKETASSSHFCQIPVVEGALLKLTMGPPEDQGDASPFIVM